MSSSNSSQEVPSPLDVLINRRLVGRLEKAAHGAINFQFGEDWLAWEHRFAISVSQPLSPLAYRGADVARCSTICCQTGTMCRRVTEHMSAKRGFLGPAESNRARLLGRFWGRQ